jgi:D-alanyl-lipoteichoic acid acyltransferase DltB (MBOAT superfamily)
MLFTEARFYLWLAFALVVFWTCPVAARKRVLLGLSVVYCLASSLQGTAWLAFAFLVTWVGSRQMLACPEDSPVRGRWLTSSVVVLIGMLAIAKFGPKLLPSLTPWVAGEGSLGGLPLGISYFTFHCLGYLLDVYWTKNKPMPVDSLGLYVTFFPKAVMGPIARSGSFKEQTDSLSSLQLPSGEAISACFQICIGLFLKFVLADRIMLFVNGYFQNVDQPDIPGLLGAAMFSWQLYYDFFSYSLIAVGTGRLFGIRLPNNFNRPFFATSVSDFWSRWHISLSSWFQEYFYTPLRFRLRRKRRPAIFVASMTTFVAIGIWHGTGWTFVVLGLLNGFLVSAEALYPKLREAPKSKWLLMPRMALTFLLIATTLVLFRAPTLAEAGSVYFHYFSFHPGSVKAIIGLLSKFDWLLLAFLGCIVELLTWKQLIQGDPDGCSWIARIPSSLQTWILALVIALTWALGMFGKTTFLYNQF